MEKLKRKHENFARSYNALNNSILVLNNLSTKVSKNEHNVITAGVIKHFELAYETAWKFLKQYLELKMAIEIASPKAVFKSCYEYKILPLDLVQMLIVLADDRNLTVHIYDQATAEEVCKEIVEHYKALGKILEILNITKE